MVFHKIDTLAKHQASSTNFGVVERSRRENTTEILITNRTHWASHRVLKVYKQHWTGTEPFHRDGKQQLGMGECQLRNGVGQTRHMQLVVLVYSALMRQLKHDRALEWAHKHLTTIGEFCCSIAREVLAKTLGWAIEQV